MPLEDLIPLGYEVYRVPEGSPPGDGVVGYGKQWTHFEGHTDEEQIVTEATNHKALYDKLVTAQTYFADNYTNWATMTAVQKDAANRQAQRALRNLVQHTLGDLTSGGS